MWKWRHRTVKYARYIVMNCRVLFPVFVVIYKYTTFWLLLVRFTSKWHLSPPSNVKVTFTRKVPSPTPSPNPCMKYHVAAPHPSCGSVVIKWVKRDHENSVRFHPPSCTVGSFRQHPLTLRADAVICLKARLRRPRFPPSHSTETPIELRTLCTEIGAGVLVNILIVVRR
jgi:hypothetical protein